MKVNIEVEVPEFEWVDAPTLFHTPIGEVGSMDHVDQVKYLIQYLQNLDDIEFIINSNHQHVRHPFCRELVRDRLRFVPDNLIWHVGESLSHFLMDFREMSGNVFRKYEFKYRTLSNGKKVAFKKFTMMFNTEEEAIRHVIKNHVGRGNFEYTICQTEYDHVISE